MGSKLFIVCACWWFWLPASSVPDIGHREAVGKHGSLPPCVCKVSSAQAVGLLSASQSPYACCLMTRLTCEKGDLEEMGLLYIVLNWNSWISF